MSVRASASVIDFDWSKETVGKHPSEFQQLTTGQGKPADWKIVEEKVPPILAPLSPNAAANFAMTPVLSAQSDNPSPDYCAVLLYTNEVFTDFSFSTRFKIPGGATEAVAGIVFRAQDENNYYVLRASTEGNLLWYRVIGGKQYDMLGIGVRISIPIDTWQELRVDCSGSGIRCFLNGRLAIPPAKPGAPTNDLAINDTTFAGGKAGFWTRGASRCCFVDSHINYTQKTPLMQTVAEATKKKIRGH